VYNGNFILTAGKVPHRRNRKGNQALYIFLTLRQNIFPLVQLINDLLAHRARKANGLGDDLFKH
jgi:hypothetical protein